MDSFVRNFIIMSIVYLGIAAVIGIMMFADGSWLSLRFVHSHLMLLGWVSMMIYGVGYHILPKFAGKFLKHRSMAVAQFWLANMGLVGMVVFYPLMQMEGGSGAYRTLAVASSLIEALAAFLFFYNMLVTLIEKPAE